MNTTTKNTLKTLGFVIAVPVLYALQELIPGWNAPTYVKAGIAAGIAYIIKLLLPSLPE